MALGPGPGGAHGRADPREAKTLLILNAHQTTKGMVRVASPPPPPSSSGGQFGARGPPPRTAGALAPAPARRIPAHGRAVSRGGAVSVPLDRYYGDPDRPGQRPLPRLEMRMGTPVLDLTCDPLDLRQPIRGGPNCTVEPLFLDGRSSFSPEFRLARQLPLGRDRLASERDAWFDQVPSFEGGTGGWCAPPPPTGPLDKASERLWRASMMGAASIRARTSPP